MANRFDRAIQAGIPIPFSCKGKRDERAAGHTVSAAQNRTRPSDTLAREVKRKRGELLREDQELRAIRTMSDVFGTGYAVGEGFSEVQPLGEEPSVLVYPSRDVGSVISDAARSPEFEVDPLTLCREQSREVAGDGVVLEEGLIDRVEGDNSIEELREAEAEEEAEGLADYGATRLDQQ
jgi:hypothetical protein